MRRISILTTSIMTLAAFSVATGEDKAAPKPAVALPARAASKLTEKPAVSPTGAKPANQSISNEHLADETAIRLTGETFVKAYCSADAKAIAAHFTTDAEYIDEQGTVYQGREAIEEAMNACLVRNPGCRIAVDIDSIRFVGPGVAIEDGITTLATTDQTDLVYSRYTAIHVKSSGKWLTASVREQTPTGQRQHRSQLQQLAWLQGDWVDEGEDSVVIFSCGVVDDGNFLLRKFTIQIAGQEAMSGTQRIGWDPLTGKLRAWIFDSEGGYGDGSWHRDGDRWILKLTGVTADGQTASSTSIYTFVNEHTMTWQSVDHEIAGEQLPDSELVTIVRRAPSPESVDDTVTSKLK